MGANALIENVFRECIKACANTTYTYIFNNSNQLHVREFGEDQKAEPALEKDFHRFTVRQKQFSDVQIPDIDVAG